MAMKRTLKRALDLSVPPFSRKLKCESGDNGGSGWKYGLRLVYKHFYNLYFPKYADDSPIGVYGKRRDPVGGAKKQK